MLSAQRKKNPAQLGFSLHRSIAIFDFLHGGDTQTLGLVR